MKLPSSWQRNCLIALCAVLAVVLVVLLLATGYVHYLLNFIDRVEPEEGTLSSEEIADMTEETDPDHTGPAADPTDIVIDLPPVPEDGDHGKHIVNVLLVGQDRREGEKRQRSDVMMLCTFNTKKKTVTLTSFLRDTYVYVPDHGFKKLNAAYVYGGFGLLNETLRVNFGVYVDANVEVDFFGFTEIIDLLGGVDITLTQKEADYLNENKGFEYNQEENWTLKAGVNHLTGAQALAYSRIRKIDSDFGRTQRQRAVVMALIESYKNKGLGTMLELVPKILPMIRTDLTNGEILSYVTELFPMVAGAEYGTMYIPAKGTWRDAYVTGLGSCLIPDLKENRAILEKLFEK